MNIPDYIYALQYKRIKAFYKLIQVQADGCKHYCVGLGKERSYRTVRLPKLLWDRL